jgi:hypothetical protein
MKLIGAGFGRTGTMSIKAALEQIGFGPCYHMKIAIYRAHHLRLFMRAWNGNKVNWKRFFRRYNSVVDWPTCCFYKELMLEFPDAKILLNIRDPEAWYDSMFETIWAIQPAFPWWFPPVVRKLHDEMIWKGNFKGNFTDKEKTIAAYIEWAEEVKRTVPPDRLLVYNVKEGWKPLCDFLEVPVPEGKEFPHINEKKSFQRVIRLLKVLNWLVPALIVLTIIFLVIFLWFYSSIG